MPVRQSATAPKCHAQPFPHLGSLSTRCPALAALAALRSPHLAALSTYTSRRSSYSLWPGEVHSPQSTPSILSSPPLGNTHTHKPFSSFLHVSFLSFPIFFFFFATCFFSFLSVFLFHPQKARGRGRGIKQMFSSSQVRGAGGTQFRGARGGIRRQGGKSEQGVVGTGEGTEGWCQRAEPSDSQGGGGKRCHEGSQRPSEGVKG